MFAHRGMYNAGEVLLKGFNEFSTSVSLVIREREFKDDEVTVVWVNPLTPNDAVRKQNFFFNFRGSF